MKPEEKYDQRHGGAFDRGAADSYYSRRFQPHYYKGNTGTSELVEEENMTPKEIQAYAAGYEWNEQFGDKKDWG